MRGAAELLGNKFVFPLSHVAYQPLCMVWYGMANQIVIFPCKSNAWHGGNAWQQVSISPQSHGVPDLSYGALWDGDLNFLCKQSYKFFPPSVTCRSILCETMKHLEAQIIICPPKKLKHQQPIMRGAGELLGNRATSLFLPSVSCRSMPCQIR